ncbi:E3 SUMO-protein ligase PIAS2 [Lamellibrachia satsuma]|nr:E3 SUMO-protein ligase PIAS2 [Lamellibrachia satsuma]
MGFRVSELQVLLGFAGRNKSGRKTELLQRSLHLIEKGCSTPIQIKIRELYKRRFPTKLAVASGASASAAVAAAVSAVFNGTSGSQQSMNYAKDGIDIVPPTLPVHPDVRFKSLPFYDKLGELLKPSSLVPHSNSRFQETFFVFHLTPQQAQDIAMSRDMFPGGRVEYTVQVQLRFCLLETSCLQEDNFPPSICVRINNKMASLPNPIPTNKPGVEPKRPSRPVNITSLCRISPTNPNHVSVSWATEFGRSYCIAVYLVRRVTSDTLLTRLKQAGFRHPDHTSALIKEKLAQDPDNEIATTSLRISLLCPLAKTRITKPCRANSCNHLQCFDAASYLRMNERKPTWLCPICDKLAEFHNLMIDGLLTEILEKADSNVIQFLQDGSWEPIPEHEKSNGKSSSSALSSPSPMVHMIGDSPAKLDVIDLTESDDEEVTDEPAVVMSLSSSSSPASSGSGNSNDTTLSTSSASPKYMGPSASISPTVIATMKAPLNFSMKGSVSPSIISLDTPPHLSSTPPTLPCSPQQPRTPMSATSRTSPYPSPPRLSRHTPSPLVRQPPPSYSHVSAPHPLSMPTLAHTSSASSSAVAAAQSLYNNLEAVSDNELDDFFSYIPPFSTSLPTSLSLPPMPPLPSHHPLAYPTYLNPYTPAFPRLDDLGGSSDESSRELSRYLRYPPS